MFTRVRTLGRTVLGGFESCTLAGECHSSKQALFAGKAFAGVKRARLGIPVTALARGLGKESAGSEQVSFELRSGLIACTVGSEVEAVGQGVVPLVA